MRLHNPIRKLLSALVGVALLAPAPALAQRRVIAPPGAKPAPVAEKPADPAATPAQPATAQEEEAPGAQVPAKKKAPAAQPKKDEPPPPPTILVPKDEQQAPAPAAAAPKAAAGTEEREVLYRKKVNKRIVSLRVRPGKPVPGKTTRVAVEVIKLLETPDPTTGDRMPEEGATLFANVGLDGSEQATRYALHPLKDAGIYAMHFTAPTAGVYRIHVEQVIENTESEDVPLSTVFNLGIGVATPMEAADEDEGSVRRGRGRSALKAISDNQGTHPEGPVEVMKQLGASWLDLLLALDKTETDPAALEPAAKSVAELSGKIAGQVPASQAADGKEFDALAAQFRDAVQPLPTVLADREKARALMTRVENDNCTRCHAKFRYQITDDLGGWPSITPKARPEPKADGSSRR